VTLRPYPGNCNTAEVNVPNELSAEAAACIVEAFEDYNDEFGSITRRARRRFDEREWKLAQRDSVERIELYDHRVAACVARLVGRLGSAIGDQEVWRQVRSDFATQISDCRDRAFYKTFFNSLTRKAFNTVGVNTEVEFLAPDLESTQSADDAPILRFEVDGDLPAVVQSMLERFPSDREFADIDCDAAQAATEIDAYATIHHQAHRVGNGIDCIEILEPVFYRATRAFIVGRVRGPDWIAPLVLAIRIEDDGLAVDATITSMKEVRSLFGFSRSYFHVDIPAVAAAVRFLASFMQDKPVDELYSVLGRAKQGKTERYRRLYKHLAASDDIFVHAEGQRGMVMIVFTLPSLDLVFKIIRDRFAYPKESTREQVMGKYQFVFKHDRVGRLVDAQEFRRLRLKKSRFSDSLLEELLQEADQSCRVDGDDIIVEHCYVERRLRPLDLYLQEVNAWDARQAVVDYGQAIKDLARTNVFPGDLLLKNFGVTRNGRIIFYDYDELCLVTDCIFRDLPTARFEEDEMRAEPWFHVGANDIFPEQFVNFLGLSAALREELLDFHADLFTADFWRGIKACHEAEKLLEVIPYAERSRGSAAGIAA
jgi:isocitrate dehydrogenase kinase/phosphatase